MREEKNQHHESMWNLFFRRLNGVGREIMAYQQVQGLNLGIVLPESYPKPGKEWEVEVGQFERDGRKTHFFYHLKRPTTEGEKTCALVVLHGFGEHGGRYFHFPEYLKNEVSEFLIIDQEGHGRSPGSRGDIAQADPFFEDLKASVESARKRFTAKKIGFFAHSFGGLTLLEMFRRFGEPNFSFFMVSAPYLKLKIHVPIVKRLGAHLLSRVWGGLSLTAEYDRSVISRDTTVIEAIKRDRLNHTRMTPRAFTTIEKTQIELFLASVKCDAPISFWIPDGDPLVDSTATRVFFQENLHSSKKEWFSFAEGRHELMNELNRDDFFRQLGQWIRGQLSS